MKYEVFNYFIILIQANKKKIWLGTTGNDIESRKSLFFLKLQWQFNFTGIKSMNMLVKNENAL